jgi:hypothetical protein
MEAYAGIDIVATRHQSLDWRSSFFNPWKVSVGIYPAVNLVGPQACLNDISKKTYTVSVGNLPLVSGQNLRF